MKTFFGFPAFVLCALFAAFPAYAQRSDSSQSDTPSAEVFTQITPKDILTRAKAHTELGMLYFQGGELIVALEELTLAISINPDYAPAYGMRGVVLYYVKEFDSAEKDFQRAIQLDAKDPEINNNYGWYLCHTGKEKESIEYFEKAYKNALYRTPEVAILNAGMCHVKLNDLDFAEELIRRSLRLSPDNSQAYYQLALISYKRENYDAAREHLSRLQSLLNEPGADVLWLSLRIERRLGNEQAESSLAAQLKRKFHDSPEYADFLKGNFE